MSHDHHDDAPVPAPQSWHGIPVDPIAFSRAASPAPFLSDDLAARRYHAHPAPAEACSEIGFENEPAPRRARLGGVHGLERWFLRHPTATTVGLLVLVGLAYLGTAK